MKTTQHGIEDSRDVENMYHMRLMTLLQELVRERGYKGAARVLKIDQRTVAESARTGRLSRRMRERNDRLGNAWGSWRTRWSCRARRCAGVCPRPWGFGEFVGRSVGRDEIPRPKSSMRREYPDLVTPEPADDDKYVFGDASSLIVAWRELKESHPNEGKGLEWLVERERRMEMELVCALKSTG